MNPQWTYSQRQWLHSSVGRASHRYREVTGSYPVEVLNFFFQASLRNCINCVHCDDHFFIFISFSQFLYDLFHISLTHNWHSNLLHLVHDFSPIVFHSSAVEHHNNQKVKKNLIGITYSFESPVSLNKKEIIFINHSSLHCLSSITKLQWQPK